MSRGGNTRPARGAAPHTKAPSDRGPAKRTMRGLARAENASGPPPLSRGGETSPRRRVYEGGGGRRFMNASRLFANLPNLITLARLLMTPLAVSMIVSQRFVAAFVIFVAAGISDGVDGFLAKRFD